MRRVLLLTMLLCAFVSWVTPKRDAEAELVPRVVSVEKIWNAAPHNAFTDLVRWHGKFYCAFREGEGHAGDRGKLRIIHSTDGQTWQSAGLLEDDVYDLRDAAISVTPDDRLMVLGGVQHAVDGERKTGTFVSFSKDGLSFTKPKVVIEPGRWLWRVTWHKDAAYGVSYGTPDDRQHSALLTTSDGTHYELVTNRLLSEGEWPTEARVRFSEDGTAFCLHRRDRKGNTAYFGIAKPPYTDWEWHDSQVRVGGPNFLQIPGGDWIATGRLYDGGARTSLMKINPTNGAITPLLDLPSGGDTSYPGMVWHDNQLWVSYYSSHEDKTSIYLARIVFEEPTVKIGDRRELFVDRHLIEKLTKAELRLHHPRAAEEVIRFDESWEGAFCGYVTVIQDEDRMRMYYRGLPKVGKDGTDYEVTCYAESTDGVNWDKPHLGIHEINGSKDNNVVLKGETPASHNFSPFLDSNPNADPSNRYKALGGTSKGLIAFGSPDGLHWKRLQPTPVFTQGVFDSQNVPFYSIAEQKYVCYFRTWTKTNYGGFRTISRTASDDFIHWSDPVAMTFGDTPYEHLYTNQTGPYFRAPHISLAVAARFMPGRRVISNEEAERIGVDPGYFGDVSDAVLLSTRGGNVYARTFMESFIRPGLGIENWVSRTNYPALGILSTGPDEISVYVQKNYGQPTSHLQRYTLRTDGFVSVSAGYDGGELLTKPLDITVADERTKRTLEINASTSAAGSIRVEVLDEAGRVIPGFSAEECDVVIGDRVARTVSWKGNSDFSAIAAHPVRLRFLMKDADLYSLRIQ